MIDFLQAIKWTVLLSVILTIIALIKTIWTWYDVKSKHILLTTKENKFYEIDSALVEYINQVKDKNESYLIVTTPKEEQILKKYLKVNC